MSTKREVSRRHFVGSAATAAAYLGFASGPLAAAPRTGAGAPPMAQERDEYDALAKVNFNENPYGPSEKVMEAMQYAFKYSMRYGYPDGGITRHRRAPRRGARERPARGRIGGDPGSGGAHVLVGRPFPPMLEHMRVSIGTESEMDRFMNAFEDIFGATASSGSRGRGRGVDIPVRIHPRREA